MKRYTFRSLKAEASLYNGYAQDAGLNVTYEVGNAYGYSEAWVRSSNGDMRLLESGLPRQCMNQIRQHYNRACNNIQK